VSNVSTSVQHSLGIPSQSNKSEEEVNGIQIGKERVKLFTFEDDVILYINDPKHSTKKLLDTINTFSNVAGYKANLQKSVAFLYTNNEQFEKNIGK
jgi:hypothetical protein